MSDYQSILVYYDGSEESQQALNRIPELRWQGAGELHVLAVADISTALISTAGIVTDLAYSTYLSNTSQLLDNALCRLKSKGIRASGYLSHGTVVDSVVHYAERLNAGLIVAGFRHRQGISRLWRGRPWQFDLIERLVGRMVVIVSQI
ncbi:universal stress protein [Paraburkholderia nodosa]|uniref:universal stress protein n=1 Tax=Paraburkholderia nodosa TaxID=392320 RepID=UPI0009F37D67|nr:universal stress protein [Paraburkholderia nodosa]